MKAARPVVLHVDDFEEFLDDFRELFSESLDIAPALSAQEGLVRLEGEPFDAVVLDYDLPGMDGVELTRLIKGKWPLLPIIFCTSRGSEQVARQAFTAGASDYFVKDFSLAVDRERFLQAVRQAIDQRRVEEALQKDRRLMASIIDYNPFSILIYDRRGANVGWNRAALELWGSIPPPEYEVFADPALLKAGYGPLFDRVRAGEVVHFPTVCYEPSAGRPNISSRRVQVSSVAIPLLDEEGAFDRMVVMHEDVTARIQAEEDLRRASDDLRQSHDLLAARVGERTAELAAANQILQGEIRERERLQQELVRKNRELEAFSSRVGHDLRNELVALRWTLEIMRGPADRRKKDREMIERLDRLMAFVQQLLELARWGRAIARRVEIPTEPFLSEIFQRVRPPQVEADLRLSPGTIPGDPLALELVFAHLLGNSFHFADPSKERVEVEVELEAGPLETRVDIRDNGRGIAPESLGKIFDTSFTTDRRRHFGMGLSFVRKIVEAHGGRVQASSSGSGRGAHFTLFLPRRRSGK